MILSEYITQLKDIQDKHGGNLEVIYSADDEGNWFRPAVYSPSIGKFDGNEFDTEEKANAVCIN
jgi:hypothetical protein